MASTIFILGVLANSFLLIVCIPALALLFLRYYQTKVAQIRPMILINLATILLAINETIILATSDEELIIEVLAPITIILWMLCFGGFAFFLAGLTRNSIFCKETALILLLAGLVIGLAIAGSNRQLEAIREYGASDFEISPIMGIFMGPLMIFVSIWGYKVLNKTRKFAVTIKQEQQQKIFTWGMSTAFFGPILANSFASIILLAVLNLEREAYLFSIATPNLLIGLGLLSIIIIYGSNKEAIYLQPQQLYSLMLIENSGLPLFEFNFPFRMSEKKISQERSVNVALTAGALKAITSFLREAVGGRDEIREIVTIDRVIIAKSGHGFFSVLISERASSFVHQALTQFTAIFDKEYGDYIRNFTGKLTVFRGVDQIVRTSFGLEL